MRLKSVDQESNYVLNSTVLVSRRSWGKSRTTLTSWRTNRRVNAQR